GHIDAFDLRQAACWTNTRRQNADGGCLAGPIRTEQAKEFAAWDLEHDPVQRFNLEAFAAPGFESFSEVVNRDYSFHHQSPLPKAGSRPPQGRAVALNRSRQVITSSDSDAWRCTTR